MSLRRRMSRSELSIHLKASLAAAERAGDAIRILAGMTGAKKWRDADSDPEFHGTVTEAQKLLTAAHRLLAVLQRKWRGCCAFQGCWRPATARHLVGDGQQIDFCATHSSTSRYQLVGTASEKEDK